MEAELAGLKAMVAELRQGRDQWQQQAERASLVLLAGAAVVEATGGVIEVSNFVIAVSSSLSPRQQRTWATRRTYDQEQDNRLLILHIRQDLKIIVFLIAAIAVAVIADLLSVTASRL